MNPKLVKEIKSTVSAKTLWQILPISSTNCTCQPSTMKSLKSWSELLEPSNRIRNPSSLGNLNQIPIEILYNIIFKLNLVDIMRLKLVSCSFLLIILSAFERTMIRFSDPIKFRYNTSALYCITFFPQKHSDDQKIIEILKSHQFSNLRVLKFHNSFITHELMEHCTQKLHLEYLDIVGCAWAKSPEDWLPYLKKLAITLKSNMHLEDVTSCKHSPPLFWLPGNLEKCTIYISEDYYTLEGDACHCYFNASNCHKLKHL
jgi:hypothetical protein